MEVRLAAVSLSVGFTGIPWVALMLLTQRVLRSWRDQSSPRDGERVAPIAVYLQLWNMITACLMTFGVFVAVALIPTGALRSLWLAHAQAEGKAAGERKADVTAAVAAEFPALDVLLYGAFFAIILTALAFPVLALWRSTTKRIVDEAFPLRTPDDVTAEAVEGRQRVEILLHLDTGLLRNPLTVFTVFTPLITSLLAAFVPQLGQ